ncbi:MAG: hypothetical protein DSY55_01040 [Clostridia bacterium]|nr:MAG: hypothetical protein DSY55_01040 [Clostridia bacterium]
MNRHRAMKFPAANCQKTLKKGILGHENAFFGPKAIFSGILASAAAPMGHSVINLPHVFA